MLNIVIINSIISKIKYVCLENDFMVMLFFIVLVCEVINIVIMIIIVVYFFLILFFSFEVIEAVYMNSVIIPEEKVMISTMGSHLENISF